MTFQEAMNMLRTRIGEIRSSAHISRRPLSRRTSLRFGLSTRFGSSHSVNEGESATAPRQLTLTFRTVEERLRRVRLKAARNTNSGNHQSKPRDTTSTAVDVTPSSAEGENSDLSFMKAELRTLHKSMYLVLGAIGTVPYEVHNRTQSSTVYYRQRGCFSHPWRTLKPGASEVYCWEEPMKAKRLTVRVATEGSFAFATQKDRAEAVGSEAERVSEVAEFGRPGPRKSVFSGNVKDEEDSEFSPSVSVRLEEIGFREFLQYGHGYGELYKHLELEVDVVGSTRVLVVRDIAAGSNTEDQLMGHLTALTLKCAEEEARIQQLRTIQSQLPTESADGSVDGDVTPTQFSAETLRNLMYDYPEEKSITRVHQMVVEVIEATGLSPDNYVGVCNPYVEVSLRSGSNGRTNLFHGTKQYHRTYFVRKSVNPCWNSQSFVFDIPPEAVTITRGHAVKVKVRNFRRIGRHAILGRAQIDLHSVKGQSPLLGWFPLAGRTGRRELENSLSHWGRGSIKLKIHWVYSFPALLEYFLLLSEARLADLYESVEGMASQMDKRREEERKKQERIDGFKAVRVNEAQGHRKQVTPNNFQPRLRIEAEISSSQRRTEDDASFFNSHAGDNSLGDSISAIDVSTTRRNTHRHTPSLRPDVEDQISLKRQKPQLGSLAGYTKRLSTQMASIDAVGQSVSIGAFTSWTEAKVFFNDESLDVRFDGQNYDVRLRRRTLVRRKEPAEDPSEERQIAGKLRVPVGSPSLVARSAREHTSKFAKSRASFERFARSSLRAALNPGGWLTIRPIQALNLPDTYNGMFVKVRYGSESFVSDTVDATVYPTWFKPSSEGRSEPISPETLEYFPGDLHIFVPPQKTSGSIRLSVVGEGQGQRLNTKTELGVLYIPLGAAITACIDSVEEYFDCHMGENGSSPVYLRWFPLSDPKGVLPVEGDRRTGARPKEVEKDSDHLFNDYFSKCIQLAFIWSPEIEPPTGEVHESDGAVVADDSAKPGTSTEMVPNTPNIDGQNEATEEAKLDGQAGMGTNRTRLTERQTEKPNHSGMVENYFNADIGQLSFALIDSDKARELISGCVCDIDVRYWVTKAKTRFGVSIGWFQLDQQDDYAREPVILAPTPSEYIPTVLQILALKDNLRSKNDVLSFEFIDFSIAEFDITLEETLLADVAEFLNSLRLHGSLSSRSSPIEGTVEDLSTLGDRKSLFEIGRGFHEVKPEDSLISLLSEGHDEMKGRQRVYIEQLFLGVVKFNLSYLKGTKDTRTVIEDQLGAVGSRVNDVGGRVFGMVLPSSHHEESDVFSTWSQHTANNSGGKYFRAVSELDDPVLLNFFKTVGFRIFHVAVTLYKPPADGFRCPRSTSRQSS